MSSAKPWKHRRPKCCNRRRRSSMKTRNNVGEMGDPYGTPQEVATSTALSPTMRRAIRPSKNDCTQQMMYQSTPSQRDSLKALLSKPCHMLTEGQAPPPRPAAHIWMLNKYPLWSEGKRILPAGLRKIRTKMGTTSSETLADASISGSQSSLGPSQGGRASW